MDAMARYYERSAKGMYDLVTSEDIYTEQKFSQGYPYQPGISDEEQPLAWYTVADRIHSQGAIFAQILHAGALSHGNRFFVQSTSPSTIRPKGSQI